MNLKGFLKTLEKVGYPNPKIVSIAYMVDYNIDNFLKDLKLELGENGVTSFCEKAINKISTPKGVKVDFGANEDVYCKIEVITYDEDESENDVMVRVKVTDSKILWKDENEVESYQTLDYISNIIDSSEWADYDDMMDYINQKLYNHIFQSCGFGIWIV